MIRRQRIPLGVLAAALIAILAAIGVVNGLWSKNLVVSGTVQTGDLKADWYLVTDSDEDCQQSWNPNFPCPHPKDVGWMTCSIDAEDSQIIHMEVHNAYPSFDADCEVHFRNTGTIPWHMVGFAVDPAGDDTVDPPTGLTNCFVDAQSGQDIVVVCDQMKISYTDNVGIQFDPGTPGASSLLIHVQQAAGQSDCSATGAPTQGDFEWTITRQSLVCDSESLQTYAFDVKLCVAQWNEAASYQQCVDSPQHEGPPFEDNGGDGPFQVPPEPE
jgi:hypothetical protein